MTSASPVVRGASGRGARVLALLAAVAALWWVLGGVAAAHQQGISYSDVAVEAGRVRWDLTLSSHDLTDADTDRDGVLTDEEVLADYPRLRRLFERALAVEAAQTACPLVLQDFAIDPAGAVTFHLRGPCPDAMPVRVRCGLLAATATQGYNLAKIRVGPYFVEHVFARDDVEVVFEASSSTFATFRRFFGLGVEHIATGYDHILFLVALLIVGGGMRALVGVVTAFTVAHSLTLALATLDVVSVPTRPVEAAIALSIAWVALENLVLDPTHGRWRITFAFGLVHGFGFASVLRAMALPRGDLVTSLLAFNLGVEAGQLGVVLIASPLIAALQRAPRRLLLMRAVSAAILVVALMWFFERAFGVV